MCVLNNEEILEYCNTINLIENYDKNKIKYASYDLSVGCEYRSSSENIVTKIDEEEFVIIQPYEICYILTEEKIRGRTKKEAFEMVLFFNGK